jgi:unspecific monooxygenase
MTLSLVSILALIALAGVVTYKFLVYPAFLSPLSKIPSAHPTVPFSEGWILWTRYNMRNNRATLAAHRKYGPIVRMAPNELSINCVDGGIRTVYAGGFEKHDWYPRLFPSYGSVSLLHSSLSEELTAMEEL